MRILFSILFALALLTRGQSLWADSGAPPAASASTPSAPGADGTVYGFSANSIQGKPATLSKYQGKVLLIVNVASRCGFTPQYKGLEALYEKYKDKGLVILGFPCNQFAFQEPGNSDGILRFCQANYGVTFPMFEKIEVNGSGAHPLYQFLKKAEPDPEGKLDIGWNFNKFLVGRDGRPLKRFVSQQTPESIDADISLALAQK
jgi:glutathione peroxidase